MKGVSFGMILVFCVFDFKACMPDKPLTVDQQRQADIRKQIDDMVDQYQ